MNKSQSNSIWIEEIYQPKTFQSVIFTGFDISMLSPICIVIDRFIDDIDLSFFNQYYKANKKTGGRPNFDFKILLKIHMYALYKDLSLREINQFASLGSDLHFLSQELPNFPKKTILSDFLKILDVHINDIFDLSIQYIKKQTDLDLSDLYCDGTVFEAHNNRHKIITDTNIAGYNVQFVEDGKYGLIVYPYISNKNPDSAAFRDIIEPLIEKYKPKSLTMDTGYGTPEILSILIKHEVMPVVKALKNENAVKKITDYSFELSENEDCLICPAGQFLEQAETKIENKTAYKANNCQSCELKSKCLKKQEKNKRMTINVEEFKIMNFADKSVNSIEGKEKYSHRGNKCESPNGFIKYNLNGKKLKMDGLPRNNTVIKLYSILYNLRRLISIKSNHKK